MSDDIKVVVIMGSSSDKNSMEACTDQLDKLGIEFEVKVSSAHRTPDKTRRYIKEAEKRGVMVFIAGAGMSAALPGFIASLTTRPVIGVPLPSGLPDGMDSLLSISQMPPGVPVATVAVGKAGARNAAILAAEILALQDKILSRKLEKMRNKW